MKSKIIILPFIFALLITGCNNKNTNLDKELIRTNALTEIYSLVSNEKFSEAKAVLDFVNEQINPKIENIAGRDLWCSKIYVDKDNNATSINCFSFNDEFISLLNYFEKLIEEEYFTEKAINVFGEIKENIKRIGTK